MSDIVGSRAKSQDPCHLIRPANEVLRAGGEVAVQLCPDPWPRACVLGCWRRLPPGDFLFLLYR